MNSPETERENENSMIRNPKDFYRKLDSILAEIDIIETNKILPTALEKIVNLLGQELKIKNGRLYQLSIDEFILVQSDNSQHKKEKPLPLKSDAIQEVMKHGCYIFHENDFFIELEDKSENLLSQAAFTVGQNEGVWLFIFELDDNWIREEIEFSMNTIRKAINARLVSESMKNSLRQAELIQRSLLPRRPPQLTGFDVFGKSISAEIVSGDFYDYLIFDDSYFGVAIGDASGHGLPAALLVRDVVTGLRMGIEKEMKISPVLEKLNRVIHRSTLSTSFVSLFYSEIESNGDIVYVNAGHPEPMLVHGKNVHWLKRGGTVLGPLANIKLMRGFTHISRNGILVLYSDGIIERRNHFGELYDKNRLKDLVLNHQNLTARELVSLIIDDVFNFGNQNAWHDDATLVVIKRIE